MARSPTNARDKSGAISQGTGYNYKMHLASQLIHVFNRTNLLDDHSPETVSSPAFQDITPAKFTIPERAPSGGHQ